VSRDEVVVRLWPTAQACSHARQAVRDFCCTRGLHGVADDAELLTSEVVTNAVRHSEGMLTMLLVHMNDTLAVTVRDNNAHVPQLPPDMPDPLAEGGRGLAVLNCLAGEWGIAAGNVGKTVWFRLP
jgi:sigma-B regulation protein RsbU (phosphoserine phosphatase)